MVDEIFVKLSEYVKNLRIMIRNKDLNGFLNYYRGKRRIKKNI